MRYQIFYDDIKNSKLKIERQISFEDVIDAISKDKILDDFPHYNQERYPNQHILVIEINSYVYLVPYLEKNNMVILKTIFPSRKYSKQYLGADKDD